ncbi:beta strand repeat-containing protein, partial [Sphingomonas edaphi]
WMLDGIENLSGGLGNDSLTGDGNANVLAGSAGNDSLSGGAGDDTLYGDGDINWDTHGVGRSGPIVTTADTGAGGNDTLEGGLGDDQIYGGGGIDTASYANAGGAVEAYLYEGGFGEAVGADGYDQLFNIENLTGSAFNDILYGNSEANVVDGGDGHDFLQARGGDDTVYGGSGDDYLGGGTGNDLLDGGAGFDRASFANGSTGPVTVDLRIQGLAQNTGLGMDTLIDIEAASGTAFGDTITGNSGDNWLWGASDGTGNDTLDGQEGNDLIENGAGDHVLSGGDGIDTFRYSALTSATGITLSLALQGASQNTGVGIMLLNGFENLTGSQFADSLTGDGNDNLLAGSGGDDTLVGGAGNDTLYGDGHVSPDTHGGGGSGPITTWADVATIGGVSGNDLLEGGLGNDVIDGGGGIDTATYANADGSVSVNLGLGFASGADGNDTLANIENVVGSEFADTLNGDGGDNVIEGLGGNDLIQGQGGNDTIYGGDGDDTLRGDTGENSLAVSGDDIIYGGNGNDGLRGGLGNDQLYGGANNDLLRGNGGVDYFDGGIDDGEGVNGIGDRVSFFELRATQGAVADLRTGVISNDGFGNVETMVDIESLGADTAYVDTFHGDDNRNFFGGSRGDNLYGHGGDDRFQTGAAAAVIDGGSGIDLLALDASGGWLLPDADADGLAESAAAALAGWTVNLDAGAMIDGYGNSGTVTGIENVNGSQLGDAITGDANANVLKGGDGNDVLEGGLGNDTLDGESGVDTASYANAGSSVTVSLTAGSASGADDDDTLAGFENVIGSQHDDVIIGGSGANQLSGGGGDDLLYGRQGNDELLGGDGDDFLRGEEGDDILNGGAGKDRVSYGFLAAAVGVTVNLNVQGVAQDTGHGKDTLIDIEHASGTIYNDVITGNGDDNWLWGGSNGSGVTGNDTISGGGGNDLIEVGTGNHTLDGGTGDDTLSLFGNSTDITAAGITFDLTRLGTAQNTEQGMMLATGFENVSGSIYDDFITGNNGANILLGDAGNDTLRGGDGNDTLFGDGRMAIDTHGTGGSGDITLVDDVAAEFGLTPGNDIMLGGRGNDTLHGGRGDDTMTGNQGNDSFVISAQSGDDVITDFAVNIDKIVFDALSGVDDFSDLTIVKVGSKTVISWGTTDSITLDGVKASSLDAGDFEFGSPAWASVAESLSQGSSFGQSSAMDQAALDMASVSLALMHG